MTVTHELYARLSERLNEATDRVALLEGVRSVHSAFVPATREDMAGAALFLELLLTALTLPYEVTLPEALNGVFDTITPAMAVERGEYPTIEEARVAMQMVPEPTYAELEWLSYENDAREAEQRGLLGITNETGLERRLEIFRIEFGLRVANEPVALRERLHAVLPVFEEFVVAHFRRGGARSSDPVWREVHQWSEELQQQSGWAIGLAQAVGYNPSYRPPPEPIDPSEEFF